MSEYKLYGAILGDMIGAPYEMNPIKTKDFDFDNSDNHYTDDTLMTLATADAVMNNYSYLIAYKWWGNRYYGDYYGKTFKEWLKREGESSNWSFGNGVAMRVSPIGYTFDTLDRVVTEAIKSAMVSHNHHEAIKGASAVASAIHLLHNGKSKAEVIDFIRKNYYSSCDKLEQFEKFKVSCQDSIPTAFACFLHGEDLEDVIRNAVWCGGDCDTVGSIAAELYVAAYGLDDARQIKMVESKMDPFQLDTLRKFNNGY